MSWKSAHFAASSMLLQTWGTLHQAWHKDMNLDSSRYTFCSHSLSCEVEVLNWAWQRQANRQASGATVEISTSLTYFKLIQPASTPTQKLHPVLQIEPQICLPSKLLSQTQSFGTQGSHCGHVPLTAEGIRGLAPKQFGAPGRKQPSHCPSAAFIWERNVSADLQPV